MATPDTPEINLAEFNCETPDCPRPFRFVSLFVGDSQAHYHCAPCWLAWNMAIAQRLGELEPVADAEPVPESAGT